MTDAKFTPGPWFSSLDDVWAGDPDFEAASDWIAMNVGGAGGECEANANLIAAGPLMYAACAEALSVLDDMGFVGSLPDQLRAALAKARGEAS